MALPLRSFCCNYRKWIRLWSSLPEFTETPEYPPIFDTSKKAQKRRDLEQWYASIQSLQTVEEKLIKVNMPRYYGWPTFEIHEDERIPYNTLSFIQYITRTHIMKENKFPSYYPLLDTKVYDVMSGNINEQVKNILIHEHYLSRESTQIKDDESEVSPVFTLVNNINRIILANLSTDYQHLLNCEVDPSPRIEAYWCVGGMEPPTRVVKFRKGSGLNENDIYEPVDRHIQYIAHPLLTLRNEQPLLPVVDRKLSCSADYPVPQFTFDPLVLGYRKNHRHGTNIPGFWPGNKNEFGMISFHKRSSFVKYDDIADTEALHVQAILSSFAWLLTQACYQGFSPFNDITYPLITQTVITDGQFWHFYVYQLNTTLLHSQHALQNPLSNLCWASGSLKLYDEIKDGTVIGFNEEVLKTLALFYLNKPTIREGVDLKPYLDKDVKYIADIKHTERREWLEKTFKRMYSNRPRHFPEYEIYHWEKIYKIDHKTRPLDARRRPFELHINPYKRRYDEHQLEYIPKVLRGENKRVKYKKTYYP